jgi:hypothetical protein
MTPQDLLSREAIRDLMTRYTAAGDRARLEELAACFAPDGVLEFPGARAAGLAEIAAALRNGDRNPELRLVRHHVANPLITLESADTASARSYFFVVTNAGPDHSGTYVDRLVRLSEGWRFAHRQVRIDWQSPASLYRDFGVRR